MSKTTKQQHNGNVDAAAPAFCLFTYLPEEVLFRVLFDGYLSVRDAILCAGLNKAAHQWFHESGNVLKDRLWERLLREEEFPGKTFEDLQLHWNEWGLYCIKLKKEMLGWSIFTCGTKAVQSMATCDLTGKEQEYFRQYLYRTIKNFTHRISNAHSWYKHLPTARNQAFFEVLLNLTSNMYQRHGSGGRYLERRRGDGTEFHYTWTTTENYRKNYGMFDYVHFRAICESERRGRGRSELGLKVAYQDGSIVRVPKSARVTVPVTSTVHRYNHMIYYGRVLQDAIDAGNVDLIEGNMRPSWTERHHVEGGKLPEKAAADLKAIAEAYILDGNQNESLHLLWETRFQPSNSDCAAPTNLSDWAKVAIRRQSTREHKAIAQALHEVCVQVFGADSCPDVESVLRNVA